jgi:hypothetical protein
MLAPYTPSVAEAEAMFSKEELLKFEYLLNQKWAVTRMVQSYDSDDKMAYIHGFDAGIDLLCAKAKLSNPAIAESVRELAGKMAEETAETLRSMKDQKRLINAVTSLYGK